MNTHLSRKPRRRLFKTFKGWVIDKFNGRYYFNLRNNNGERFEGSITVEKFDCLGINESYRWFRLNLYKIPFVRTCTIGSKINRNIKIEVRKRRNYISPEKEKEIRDQFSFGIEDVEST